MDITREGVTRNQNDLKQPVKTPSNIEYLFLVS